MRVIGETEECGSGGTVSCTHSVTVYVNNTEVQLLKDKEVLLNGVSIDPPFENQFVSVRRATSKFQILEIFGMRVKWDGVDRLYITLAPYYINKVKQ